jgi:hypothetical protein
VDDQQQPLEEPVVSQDNVTESAPVEQTPDTEPQPSVETPETEVSETEDRPQRNANGRIRELVSEKKRIQAERDMLAEQLQQAAQMQIPDEIDPGDYRALQFNNNVVLQELQALKMERMQEKLEMDTERVYSEFSELKDNKALDDKLSRQWYEAYAVKDAEGNITGYTKSPHAFVKEQMDIINSARQEATAQNIQNLQRQAGESAVTPTTTTPSNPKDPKEMSLNELERKLGIVQR